MRHRVTTAELSASQSEVDKAILAERERVIALLASVKSHLDPAVFGRLSSMIHAGEDLGAAADDPPEDRPVMVDFPGKPEA